MTVLTEALAAVVVALLLLAGWQYGQTANARRETAVASADAATKVAAAASTARAVREAYSKREAQFAQSIEDLTNDAEAEQKKRAASYASLDARDQRLRSALKAYAAAPRASSPGANSVAACSGDDPRVATLSAMAQRGFDLLRRGFQVVGDLSAETTLAQQYAQRCYELRQQDATGSPK